MFDYTKGYTLVTGASYGLGAEFARQIAVKGSNLILVARSVEKMTDLSNELQKKYNIKIIVIQADLTKQNDINRLLEYLKTEDIKVNLLINNAGVGSTGSFLSHNFSDYKTQIQLNNQALVELTYNMLPSMLTNKYGGIINIASIVAFQPMPYMSVYAASKAFVLSFSESLSYEVKKSNIKVLASCPTTTATHFFDNLNANIKRKQMDSPVMVVRKTIRDFENGKNISYSGRFLAYYNLFVIRFIPRSIVLKIVGKVSKLFSFNNI